MITLGAGDFFNILPGELAVVENLIAYIAFFFLWYELNMTEIFFGSQASKLNVLLLIIFYVLAFKHLTFTLKDSEFSQKHLFEPLGEIFDKMSRESFDWEYAIVKKYKNSKNMELKQLKEITDDKIHGILEIGFKEDPHSMFAFDSPPVRVNQSYYEVEPKKWVIQLQSQTNEFQRDNLKFGHLTLTNCIFLPGQGTTALSKDSDSQSHIEKLSDPMYVNSFSHFLVEDGNVIVRGDSYNIIIHTGKMVFNTENFEIEEVNINTTNYKLSFCELIPENPFKMKIKIDNKVMEINIVEKDAFFDCIQENILNSEEKPTSEIIEICGIYTDFVLIDGSTNIVRDGIGNVEEGSITFSANLFQTIDYSEYLDQNIKTSVPFKINKIEKLSFSSENIQYSNKLLSFERNPSITAQFDFSQDKEIFFEKMNPASVSNILQNISLYIGFFFLALFSFLVGAVVPFEGNTIVYSTYILISTTLNKFINFDTAIFWKELSYEYKMRPFFRKAIIICFRSIFVYYLLILFFLFVFDTITQWMMLSIDKSLFLVGIFYVLFSLKSGGGKLAERLAAIEENFMYILTSFFLKPRFFHLGVCTLLIAYTVSDLGFYIIPTIFGGVESLDGAGNTNFSSTHKPLLTLIKEDMSKTNFIGQIQVLLIYFLDTIGVFLFLIMPAILIALLALSEAEIKIKWKESFVTMILISLFLSVSIPYFITPWTKISQMSESSAVRGIDFQTKNIIENKDIFPYVIFLSGVIFILSLLLQTNSFMRTLILASSYLMIIIFFSVYLSNFAISYGSYLYGKVTEEESLIASKLFGTFFQSSLFVSKIFGDFLITATVFYTISFFVFIYSTGKWVGQSIFDIDEKLSRLAYILISFIFLLSIPLLEHFFPELTDFTVFIGVILPIFASIGIGLSQNEKLAPFSLSFSILYLASTIMFLFHHLIKFSQLPSIFLLIAPFFALLITFPLLLQVKSKMDAYFESWAKYLQQSQAETENFGLSFSTNILFYLIAIAAAAIIGFVIKPQFSIYFIGIILTYEFILRGVMFTGLKQHYDTVSMALIISLINTLLLSLVLHITAAKILGTFFVLSIIACLLRHKSQSIMPSMVMQLIFAVFVFL